MALNGSVYLPQSESTADVEAARALTFPEQAFFPHFNWWADPAVLGHVPAVLQPFFTAEELKIACQPLDFLVLTATIRPTMTSIRDPTRQ